MNFGNFALDPQLREALEKDAAYLLERGYEGASEVRQLAINEALGLKWNENRPEVSRISSEILDIDRRPVEIRSYIPQADTADRYVVWVHGGGWNEGSLDIYDRLMRVLANAAKAPVVGIGYTKVPKAQYPVQIDQLLAAYGHIDRAVFPGRAKRNVAGFSAGANLIMSSLVRGGGLLGAGYFEKACLVCGVYDCDFSSSSYEAYDGFFGNSKERLRRILENYAPGAVGRKDPLVFPVNTAPTACGQYLIISAEHDLLREDSRRLAANLEDQGLSTIYRCHSGMTHIFIQRSMSVGFAHRSIIEMGEYFAL